MFTWSDYFLPSGAQTASEAQANANNQAARLAAQNAARVAAGTIGNETLARNQAAIANVGNFATEQNKAAREGFVEGLKEGVGNIKDAVTGWGLFKLVPIWVYVATGLGLFLYLGGLPWLKRKLK